MIQNPDRAANLTEVQWERLLELGRNGSFTLALPASPGDDVVLIQDGRSVRIRWDGDYTVRTLVS